MLGWVLFVLSGVVIVTVVAIGVRMRPVTTGTKGGDRPEIAPAQRVTVIGLVLLGVVGLVLVGLLAGFAFLVLGFGVGLLSRRWWPVDLQRTRPPLP